MPTVDEAYEKAQAILDDAVANLDKIKTEEDSKLQLITRMLVDCLGWQYSDIGTEIAHDNGYSDYLLSEGDRSAIIVEAKRLGIIGPNTDDVKNVRELKIDGPALKDARAGIQQAASYALPNGVSLAVLTDGLCWIVFKPHVPGEKFTRKQAYVFSSPTALKSDFSKFYDLMAKVQYNKKIYKLMFDRLHSERTILIGGLHCPISEDNIRLRQKSELSYDLDKIFETFFSKMSDESDEELLIECFVETKESRIADFSLEKLTSRVLGNISHGERDLEAQLSKYLTAAIDTDSGETVFIVGPTGAGKTTFLTRFFKKTLTDSVRTRCVPLRVNCLDASGSTETVTSWLTESLVKLIEARLFADGTPTWDQLRGLYEGEYRRKSKGVDEKLYNSDKDAFQAKFSTFMEGQVEKDREGYLKRLVSDLVVNRKFLPVLIIDNTDEFAADYKSQIFQFTQAIRRHAGHCILIFPVTDKSAWSFSKTDIYSIYGSKSFFLPTPPPREVFRKRIAFLKAKLAVDAGKETTGRYFTDRGIKVSIANLSNFSDILEGAFVNNEFTSKTLGELSNYNIRRTLRLSRRVITSAEYNVSDILRTYSAGAEFSIKSDQFMNALLKGDFELYKPSDIGEIVPIFQVDSQIRQSPLLHVRVLSYLRAVANAGRDIEERHVSLDDLHTYFDVLGCSEAALDRSILYLMSSKLCEPFDPSVRDLTRGQRVAIGFGGRSHQRMALSDPVFFEQMALTTAITNESVADQIRGVYRANSPLSERLRATRSLFAEYLLNQDGQQLTTPMEGEQFETQREVSLSIAQFVQVQGETVKQRHIQLGEPLSGIVATIDFYSAEKGYGFAEAKEVEGKIFVHAEAVRACGRRRLNDGDDILCDIEHRSKGPQVVKIHEVQGGEDYAPVKCVVVRLFPERRYGFVRSVDAIEDAFFHYSLLGTEFASRLQIGIDMQAVIRPDTRGRGSQVKVVLSLAGTPVESSEVAV